MRPVGRAETPGDCQKARWKKKTFTRTNFEQLERRGGKSHGEPLGARGEKA